MSDKNGAQDALLTAIEQMAQAAPNSNTEGAKNLAIAAKEFAEAYAWLSVPNQPH